MAQQRHLQAIGQMLRRTASSSKRPRSATIVITRKDGGAIGL
jgi:secreted PhoX family phosphatase